ncbi:MAG TPA: hypothetical protein VMM55_01805 [Thermohalobaculum sp.]|nr:hypothetical protein [Thermohalobaculum sp.]
MITRHDTPPSQLGSPRFDHSSNSACSKALLEAAGHAAVMFDGHLEGRSLEALADAGMTTEGLAERLAYARGRVPFVQANLIGHADDPDLVVYWRDRLRAAGVWANDPVPLFPYPASPHYHRLFGEPDARAWERAHEHYLAEVDRFSDLQEVRPKPLPALERALQ